MKNIEEKVKETQRLIGFFRIHRRDEMRKLGFGSGGRMETHNFCAHLKRHKLVGTKTTRASGLVAVHLRAKNKGYPRDFVNYRTYDPKKEKRLSATSGYYSRYIPEVKLPTGIA